MREKIIAFLFCSLGLALLIYTWKPVVEWTFFIKPQLLQKSTTFLSPLAQNPKEDDNLLGQSTPFPNLNFGKNNFNTGQKKTFFLTIEKFGIKRAKVVTGEDFMSSLAHLPQSSHPGRAGNVFISGHAALPQFFSPENYWSIFSKLYQLEIGDRIVLEEEDKSYVYSVSEMLVVEPGDIWVIRPPTHFGSYLTLLTCGVGGLTTERIIVRAVLTNSQKIV